MADLAHLTVTKSCLSESVCLSCVRECAEVLARSSCKHEIFDSRRWTFGFWTCMPVSFRFYNVNETCIKVRNLKPKVGN
jgi:hypothetical protein